MIPNEKEELIPGDRNDNQWITIDNYQSIETQTEWENLSFFDEPYHGYFTWPKIIKYRMNKPIHYTMINMSENVQTISQRFVDQNFMKRFLELIISNEDQDEKNVRIKFNKERILMFKVTNTFSFDQISSSFFKRVFLQIMVSIFSIFFSMNFINNFIL